MGCGGNAPRDLGSSSTPLANAAGSEPLTPQDFIGNWVGVAEDPLELTDTGQMAPLHFASGSSRIALVVYGGGGSTHRFASLTFGEDTPPPAASDPDAPPPGIPAELLDTDPFNTPPLEGFPYFASPVLLDEDVHDFLNLVNSTGDWALSDGILRLGFYADEIFEDYCALQTPGSSRLVQASLEGRGVCDCVPDGCTANIGNPLGLWLRHSPAGLVGVIVGNLRLPNARGSKTSIGQIRFTRT
jgi:hypothetical protein